MGSESLFINRQGVDTSGHNIANANTEGYSRQRLNTSAREPIGHIGMAIGNGVMAESITRANDQYIDKQLNDSKQVLGESSTRSEELQKIELIYNTEATTNIANRLAEFFASLHDLSAYPEDLSARTNVREAGYNLVTAIKGVDESLRTAKSDVDSQIKWETGEINHLLDRIADLNVKIVGSDGKANDYLDERDRVLRKLGEKIQISYYTTDAGSIVVRGPGQTLLVEGKEVSKLDLRKNEKGDLRSYISASDGSFPIDVTDRLKRGSMSALFYVRNNVIDGLMNKNNELAYTFSNRFNEVHRQGFGVGAYNETTGRNFFKEVHSMKDAAMNLDLDEHIALDVNAIATAASSGSIGDNVVVNRLIDMQKKKIFSDGSSDVESFYSDYVSKLGADIQRANKKKEADDLIVKELDSRRESIAGVSLDEEAVNMMKWQTAFAASSKVITTADEMLDTVLSLKR